jgi:hypothetical protein
VVSTYLVDQLPGTPEEQSKTRKDVQEDFWKASAQFSGAGYLAAVVCSSGLTKQFRTIDQDTAKISVLAMTGKPTDAYNALPAISDEIKTLIAAIRLELGLDTPA